MPTDDALVARIARGGTAAVRELFDRHAARILNLVYPIVGSLPMAEDVTQETFLALMEHAEQYRPEGKFRAWLSRIAINTALMELRERRRTAEADLERAIAEALRPDEELARAQASDIVLRALAELPEDQRIAVVLKKVEGLSYEEIAETLAVNMGTAQSRVHYGLRRLREICERMGIHEPL